MDIVALEQNIKKSKEKYYSDKGRYDQLIQIKLEKNKKAQQLSKKQKHLDKVRTLLLASIEYQREKIKKEFEDMVTNALQYILEQEIYFIIDIKESRGRAEAEFLVKSVRDGISTITNIQDSRGDGISDVVGIALDIAMLEYSNNEGPLILDEPAKQVSKQYIENVGLFLNEVSKSFNRQIIMITHNKTLSFSADKKFEVILNGTESQVITL